MSGSKTELSELAKLFLKLGITAFGGPAVHIAMMRQEVVQKRQWMSEEHFLDLLGATNLIPGPNSTEMAIHIGRERAGFKGLLVAGLCFILPAVFITTVLAWLYKQYGALPQIQPLIYGIKPVIIPVVLAAVVPLAQKAAKTTVLIMIGLTVLALALVGYNEIFLMFGSGALMLLLAALNKNKNTFNSVIPLGLLAAPGTIVNKSNVALFLVFLKVGAILYGSGYVLFALLDAELVTTGWLTRNQLMDAIACGQFTPGPVFSAVTFIGYQLNGFSGAMLATIAVFIPAFIFVAALNPLVKQLRNSNLFASFLDGVNMASVAVIAAVCFAMAQNSITNWQSGLLLLAGFVAAFGFRQLNSALIILGGAVAGYLLQWV